MGRNRDNQVYRVRQLPLHLKNCGDIAPFLIRIAPVLGAVDYIRVFSLAQEKPASKTATVAFKALPPIFDSDAEQWTLPAEVFCGRNIIVDTHFLDFTVLNEPLHCPHTVDCIAISGLASHPFGSWKHRESGSDFMWLRDRLPQDVPQLRSLIYGYDTKLAKSHSFQSLDDIAWTFIARLKEIRRSLPPAKSLVLLAHSLGGILLKRALILLAHDGSDEEKTILESVKGLVFFGVPHRGMKISHFLAIVAKQPNEEFISTALSPDSTLLPKLEEQFSEIALRIKKENIRFVYETKMSQTTEQTSTGAWVRSETSYAVLVNKDSAIPPETLRRNTIAVDKDHSNMVKFGEDDPIYQFVMSFLFDISKNTDSLGSGHKSVRAFSNVPFSKDTCFVGRENILAQLESEFANPKSRHWASLYGLGGIGKSQIAIEYSYRQKERSRPISTFWVHASSKARFEQSYATIATIVEIPGTGDGRVDILQSVSSWLADQDNGPWLLILDNADDATVLLHLPKTDTGTGATPAQRRLLDFLPQVEHGTVLITTRDRTCALDLTGHYGTPIEVQSMNTIEAVALLRNILPNANQEEASELVKELENVPLAISQASAYIREVSLASIPLYLTKFRCSSEDQATLLNKNKEDLRRDPGVPNAVITSWELSFNQIHERFPDSADLLSLMSYVNRQAIPQFLLQADEDQMSFYENINPLISFSLIRAEIGEKTFEMHRLVQTATQHWLRSEGYDQLWKECAVERVARQFPMIPGQEQHWPICEALISHADEVILHTTGSKDSELNRANILRSTAWYLLHRRWDAGLAEQRSTQALQIQLQYLDENSNTILSTLQTLAVTYSGPHKFEKALGLQKHILKQRQKMLGPEHRLFLDAMHDLAISYHHLGQFGEAEDLMKRVVISGNMLASVQLDKGKYEEAEQLGAKTLEVNTRHFGVEHSHTLSAMHDLSWAYLQQNKLKEAENLIAQALPFLMKIFGPSHRRTLEARRIVASIYYRQRKLDEAEEICMSCLDTAQGFCGVGDEMTLNITNLLGLIYRAQGKLNDASRLFRDVGESYRKVFGGDYPETLISMYNLALCYYDMGDKDDATGLMTEVLRKRREVLHANHPHVTDSARALERWKSEKRAFEEEESEEGETKEEGGEEGKSEKEATEEAEKLAVVDDINTVDEWGEKFRARDVADPATIGAKDFYEATKADETLDIPDESDDEDESDSSPGSDFAISENNPGGRRRTQRVRPSLRSIHEGRKRLRAELFEESLLALIDTTRSSLTNEWLLKLSENLVRFGPMFKFIFLRVFASDFTTVAAPETPPTVYEWILCEILICREFARLVRNNCDRLQDAGLAGPFLSVLVLSDRRENVVELKRISISDVYRLFGSLEDVVAESYGVLENERQQLRPAVFYDVQERCKKILLSLQMEMVEEEAQQYGLNAEVNGNYDTLDQLSKVTAGQLAFMFSRWRYTLEILDIVVLSHEGAHISDFDHLTLGGRKEVLSFPAPSLSMPGAPIAPQLSNRISFRRQRMNCLAGFLDDQEVWVLGWSSGQPTSTPAGLYLSTDVEMFADVFGPVWKISDSSRPDLISRYNVGGGSIVPWPFDARFHPELGLNERLSHWRSNDEFIRFVDVASSEDSLSTTSSETSEADFGEEPLESFKTTDLLLIGADSGLPFHDRQTVDPRMKWKACHCSTENIKQQLKEAGRLDRIITSRAYRHTDSQQASLIVGSHGFQAGRARTFKDNREESLKTRFLDEWENQPDSREPRELENYWGVTVSLCTGNARRVRLVEILGSDSAVCLLKRFPWSDSETDEHSTSIHNGTERPTASARKQAYLEAVRSANPRALGDLWKEQPSWRDELGRVISSCLRILFRTGYHQDRDEFHILWNTTDCHGARRITLKAKDHHWVRFLKDTTASMTVAVAERKYLGDDGECSHNFEKWNQNPWILETAICVNRKLNPAGKLKKIRGCKDEHHWLHRADSRPWRYTWDASKIDEGEQFRMETQCRVQNIYPLNQWNLLLKMDTMKWTIVREALGMRPSEGIGHWEYTDENTQSKRYRPIPVHITS